MPSSSSSRRVADSSAHGLHELSAHYHKMHERHLWRRFYHDLYQRFGDELQFSPGLFIDLWHYLTSDVSTLWLIVWYFVFELTFVFFFGVLLFVCNGIAPRSLTRCFLASARSVTVLANHNDFDSRDFGVDFENVDERVRMSGAAILMLEGFLHFMFVCVASSLIIVRALRPLQQVAFSHHCCLTDEELVIRIRILRPDRIVLIRPEVKVDVCLTSGTFVKLPLVGDGQYAKWSGNPTITIRHKVSEGSPFFLRRDAAVVDAAGEERGSSGLAPSRGATEDKVRSTLDGIAHVSCSLVATDSYGIPVTEVQQYSPTTGFMGMALGPHFEADPSLVERVPQIIHHAKFQDQIKFGVPTDEDLCHGGNGRWHGGRRRWPARWWHPHGTTKNLDVRRRTGVRRGERVEVKRLVTNTDAFDRIAPVESEIGRRSNSYSTVVGKDEAARLEKRHAAAPSGA